MQIPPASSAAQAASILAQSTSKDKSSGAAAPANSPQSTAAHVEKSGSTDPDRDAQGQGDGLPGDDQGRRPPNKSSEAATAEQRPKTGELPGEPPSQLDIVG